MATARPRPKKLPKKLAEIRRNLGSTGLELIEHLRRIGYKGPLTAGMISNFETGRREPSLPLILAYARLAKISTDILIDDALDLPKNFRDSK